MLLTRFIKQFAMLFVKLTIFYKCYFKPFCVQLCTFYLQYMLAVVLYEYSRLVVHYYIKKD